MTPRAVRPAKLPAARRRFLEAVREVEDQTGRIGARWGDVQRRLYPGPRHGSGPASAMTRLYDAALGSGLVFPPDNPWVFPHFIYLTPAGRQTMAPTPDKADERQTRPRE